MSFVCSAVEHVCESLWMHDSIGMSAKARRRRVSIGVERVSTNCCCCCRRCCWWWNASENSVEERRKAMSTSIDHWHEVILFVQLQLAYRDLICASSLVSPEQDGSLSNLTQSNGDQIENASNASLYHWDRHWENSVSWFQYCCWIAAVERWVMRWESVRLGEVHHVQSVVHHHLNAKMNPFDSMQSFLILTWFRRRRMWKIRSRWARLQNTVREMNVVVIGRVMNHGWTDVIRFHIPVHCSLPKRNHRQAKNERRASSHLDNLAENCSLANVRRLGLLEQVNVTKFTITLNARGRERQSSP